VDGVAEMEAEESPCRRAEAEVAEWRLASEVM
jgi:hypothetical protein